QDARERAPVLGLSGCELFGFHAAKANRSDRAELLRNVRCRFSGMPVRRLATPLLVTLAALVCTLPAAAKEGVTARLRSSLPLDAPAGTHLTVRWTLTARDEDGTVRPFSAEGLFVRLLSKTGAGATVGLASGAGLDGSRTATVVVPNGGIRDVQLGLR